MEHPGIFFFPLSEPTPVDVTGLEAGVLARRIPDFLCICLNDSQDNASLLEIRAADENGVPTGDWAFLREVPEPGDVMSFLPEDGVEAAIVGTLRRTTRLPDREGPGLTGRSQSGDESGLEIDLTVIRDRAGVVSKSLPWRLNLKDPGASCVALARRIAQELSLAVSPRTWERLGTKNPTAFLQFLQGLDGAACLDPNLLGSRDPVALLSSFVSALESDPDFGLALRRLHVAIHEAVQACVMPLADGLTLLDRAFSTYPSDVEAAASIGEFLAAIEEDGRAEDWLRLAVEQPEPPASALETLGILLANRGETVQARNLWLTGVRVDGHPDFFAHLARLAFSEDQHDEAWDKVIRGLRRLSERGLHPGEWDDDEGRGGVLLRYLGEHLEEVDGTPPSDVTELLADLREQIREPDDRLDLGICLLHVGYEDEGAQALRAVLPHVEDADRRDLGAQYLAQVLFPDFEEAFDAAASVREDGERAAAALEFLDRVLRDVPQFWPALYYRGKLHALREDWQGAYESFRKAAGLRRDQAPILTKLAVAAQKLGRLDDACDALGRAVEIDPSDAGLHADYALLLHKAGRDDEARQELEVAETLDPSHEVVERVREILGE